MPSKNMNSRLCQECGSLFLGGPRAWYCPECRAERKKVQMKEYQKRKSMGKTRSIGSCDRCEKCGEVYIVRSGLQKYCEKCAPEMYLEIDRCQGMEYYKKNKEVINPVRMIARRAERYCQKCGTKILAAGGRYFCEECKKDGFDEIYQEVLVERNIKRRNNSYVVKVFFEGKLYYLKSTKDFELAIKIRDCAETAKKEGYFEEWFDKFRKSGRNINS